MLTVGIAAGDRFSCALRPDRTVWCWGDSRFGQLGDGTLQPQAVAGPVTGLGGIVQIDAGLEHACARRGDGGVMCWGHNDHGQLGDLSMACALRGSPSRTCPAQPPPSPPAAATVSSMGDYCWGDNTTGQLGLGTTSRSLTAVKVSFP